MKRSNVNEMSQKESNKQQKTKSATMKREVHSAHMRSDETSISAPRLCPRVRPKLAKKARYSEPKNKELNNEKLEAARREVLSRQTSTDEDSISAPRVRRATRIRRASKASLRNSASD